MPVSYTFEDRIVVLRAEGRYPAAELRTAARAAFSDPEGPAAVGLFDGLLIDARGSLSLRERSWAELRHTAHMLAPLVNHFGSRIAMVATSDLDYGLLRVAAVTLEGDGADAAVFRDVDAAREWLLEDRRHG